MDVGARVGVDGMYQTFRQLGLFEKTGIDLPGEASSIMHQKKNVGAVELATMSFGQSIQITPLQLLRAVSAVINGGKLITPHFGVRIVDAKGNMITVCFIENIDPLGVHTGDSITVAPAQTLTDREYQKMRDASLAIMREIGVETGGSNVQFGVNPANGELVIIEMNPRVSRSSALASKATGFPIAKIAAKLAVGYTLDELRNDITRETSASFEPTIDYCVVKIPRFTFEKFPGAKDELTTSMKSVGETMAIGRTFKESLQKGLRSLEIGAIGLGSNFRAALPSPEELMGKLRTPNPRRMFAIRLCLSGSRWKNSMKSR